MLSVLFYLTVFLFVFIIQSIAARQRNPRMQKLLVLSSFAVILLLIGLRYNVGTDYAGHVNMYHNYSKYEFSELLNMRGDLGSKIIVGVVAPWFGSPLATFWIYGLISLIPLYLINRKNNFKYLAYSMLIYNLMILPVGFNLIRQGAAISFVLLAFLSIFNEYSKKNTLLSFFYLLLAIIIHTSALLLLPYFVVCVYARRRNKKIQNKTMCLITAVIVVSLFTVLKDIFVDIGFLDYNYMLDVKDDVSVALSNVVMDIAIYVPVVLSQLYANKDRKNIELMETNASGVMMSLSLSGVVFDIVGSSFNYLSRISYYFMAFYIFLNPIVSVKVKNKNLKLAIRISSIIILILLFIIRFYVQGRHEIIPYDTWLFSGEI